MISLIIIIAVFYFQITRVLFLVSLNRMHHYLLKGKTLLKISIFLILIAKTNKILKLLYEVVTKHYNVTINPFNFVSELVQCHMNYWQVGIMSDLKWVIGRCVLHVYFTILNFLYNNKFFCGFWLNSFKQYIWNKTCDREDA